MNEAQDKIDTPVRGAPAKAEMFSFGEPVPVMERGDILDYAQIWNSGKWYEPPVSTVALAKTFRSGVHHPAAVYFKRNRLSASFIPHRLLSREEFDKWALDQLVFGNSYLQDRKNVLGNRMPYRRAPAKYMRRATDLERFFQVNSFASEYEFEGGTVHQLMEPDINQEVYGMPEYLGAMNSAWLNESATLFRRKYYENGSHAGFILYMSDPSYSQEDVDDMRQALKESRGVGNFRNLFMYSPNGKKDGIQLIPISEVAAKDEFFNIKNVSRDDILAAHRTPPQLMGIVPSNTGGFGAADTADELFHQNEIEPLQRRLAQFNDWAGDEIIRFQPWEPRSKAA